VHLLPLLLNKSKRHLTVSRLRDYAHIRVNIEATATHPRVDAECLLLCNSSASVVHLGSDTPRPLSEVYSSFETAYSRAIN